MERVAPTLQSRTSPREPSFLGCNIKTDWINNIYNVTFKCKEIGFGFNKDQLSNKITLNNFCKYGNAGFGYDVNARKFNTVTAGYTIKF